jgi:beta-phosphoglucomutase-like phosphatase (HAD superfamily)
MRNTFDISHELNDRITTGTILLFDMDGTLVDTNFANYLSYRQAIQEVMHGELDIPFNSSIRFSREELKKTMPHLSDSERNKIISLKAEYCKKYLPETKLNTALVDILGKFNKTNEAVLVTNCQEDRAIMTLKYHGLIGSFSHVFCQQNTGEENKINKYENALIRLGVHPTCVFVFENETADVNDATLAGVPRENIISI